MTLHLHRLMRSKRNQVKVVSQGTTIFSLVRHIKCNYRCRANDDGLNLKFWGIFFPEHLFLNFQLLYRILVISPVKLNETNKERVSNVKRIPFFICFLVPPLSFFSRRLSHSPRNSTTWSAINSLRNFISRRCKVTQNPDWIWAL